MENENPLATLIRNLDYERKLLIDNLSLRANQGDWVRVIDYCASLLVVDSKLSIYKKFYTPPPPPAQVAAPLPAAKEEKKNG